MNRPAFPESPAFPEMLVPRVWAALCERLREPVRESRRGGMRIVEVLGVLRYYILPSARRVHFAHAAGNGRFTAGQMRDFVNLDPVLAGDLWLAYFAANWLARSSCAPPLSPGSGAGGEGIDFPAFVKHLRQTPAFRLLLDRVRACRIEGPLRDRLSESLALDPRVIRWACLGLPQGELATVDSHWYSTVWRRHEDFEQLERECPNLLRPYAAALRAGVLGQHPEPVRDLKFAFRDFDVTDAGWKMLVHTPPAYFDFVIANTRNDDLFDVHLWVLHACLGAGRQLPKRVLDRLVMPHGREPRQRVLLDPTFVERYWKPFLRALGRRLDPVSSAEELRTFLDGEFEDVYDWLEWEDPRIDANQARAGWAWMVRQHRAWQEREREFASSRRAEMRWDVPLPTFVHGRWQVVALRDSYELWEEGHHMRHCARTYADPCKNGEYVVFSIRNSSGERVATGGLERRAGRWEAGNVRVFANRPASPILVAAAQAYAAAFDEVARSGRCNDRVAA